MACANAFTSDPPEAEQTRFGDTCGASVKVCAELRLRVVISRIHGVLGLRVLHVHEGLRSSDSQGLHKTQAVLPTVSLQREFAGKRPRERKNTG